MSVCCEQYDIWQSWILSRKEVEYKDSRDDSRAVQNKSSNFKCWWNLRMQWNLQSSTSDAVPDNSQRKGAVSCCVWPSTSWEAPQDIRNVKCVSRWTSCAALCNIHINPARHSWEQWTIGRTKEVLSAAGSQPHPSLSRVFTAYCHSHAREWHSPRLSPLALARSIKVVHRITSSIFYIDPNLHTSDLVQYHCAIYSINRSWFKRTKSFVSQENKSFVDKHLMNLNTYIDPVKTLKI